MLLPLITDLDRSNSLVSMSSRVAECSRLENSFRLSCTTSVIIKVLRKKTGALKVKSLYVLDFLFVSFMHVPALGKVPN